MTIDKVKLIELLVERTGLEKEKVEEQLLQLVGRIQQAAEQGKSFQIEGFGTFSVKDDTLHFDPADTLETEINHKYAGMKPIELIGAFKEIPPVEEEEAETSPEDQPRKEPTEEERLVEKILGIQEASKPSASRQEESVADSIDEPDEEEKPKVSFVFDDIEDAGEEEESAAETVSGKTKKKDKDPIGSVLLACIVFLIIGLAGWAIYDFGLLPVSNESTQAATQDNQTVQSTSGPSEEPLVGHSSDESSSSSSGADSEDETNPDVAEQQSASLVTSEENINTQVETSVYGLMGTASTGGNNGYTIVVHSLSSENTARIMQNGLKYEGYRTVLASAVVDGNTYWRVGLGQFETIADAQEAVDKLPEQYQNNHFIKRIQ